MRTTLFASAVLCAFSGAAMAQSSVTLFGTMDLGVRHVDNGDSSVTSVSSHGASTSKIGFRGEEDLGGGWGAGFWLEAQVDPDTGLTGGSNGTGLAFFNRRSTVSLSGPWGEVRLG